MSNLTERDYHNMSIDQSFKAFKRDDLKVIYSLKLDKNDSFEKKRVITKIVKFDENNQYGFAMTKPMPTGCIKEYNSPSWLTFNLLLEKVSLDDLIVIFSSLMSNSIKKTQQKNNSCTMKFYHQ